MAANSYKLEFQTDQMVYSYLVKVNGGETEVVMKDYVKQIVDTRER